MYHRPISPPILDSCSNLHLSNYSVGIRLAGPTSPSEALFTLDISGEKKSNHHFQGRGSNSSHLFNKTIYCFAIKACWYRKAVQELKCIIYEVKNSTLACLPHA